MSPTIPLSEIAQLLGVKPATAARKARQLQEHGFPRPLPGCPTMFSRPLVEAWMRSGGQPAPVPVNDDHSTIGDMLSAQREALEARYVQH